jgi:hypothetical protein
MKNKKTLKENMVRDMVGVSAYSGRSKAVAAIVNKYPTPQKFAQALNKLSMEKGIDAKAKVKAKELALKCSKLTQAEYPEFVSKVVGLSKFWKICGATIAIGVVTAATTWLVTLCVRATDDITNYNKNNKLQGDMGAKEWGQRFKTHASRDLEDAKDAITGTYDKAKRYIDNDPMLSWDKWRHNTQKVKGPKSTKEMLADKWGDIKLWGRQQIKDINNWRYDKQDLAAQKYKDAKRGVEDAMFFGKKTAGNVSDELNRQIQRQRQISAGFMGA